MTRPFHFQEYLKGTILVMFLELLGAVGHKGIHLCTTKAPMIRTRYFELSPMASSSAVKLWYRSALFQISTFTPTETHQLKNTWNIAEKTKDAFPWENHKFKLFDNQSGDVTKWLSNAISRMLTPGFHRFASKQALNLFSFLNENKYWYRF